jgi:hypothetical protein
MGPLTGNFRGIKLLSLTVGMRAPEHDRFTQEQIIPRNTIATALRSGRYELSAIRLVIGLARAL